MPNYQKSTIRDVAAQAKVSVTTISHYVSGRSGTCSPETAERIRGAIEALHYTPNSLTRGLRQRSTRTIGVCTQSNYDLPQDAPSSYDERLWRGISLELGAHDYSLLYYPPRVRHGSDYRPFLDGGVEGLLISAGQDDPRPAQVASAGLPVIAITRSLNLPPGCGAAYAQEKDTVNLALAHLWELGHRRIAHVAGPMEHNEVQARFGFSPNDIAIRRHDGYVAWLQARDAYDPALIAHEHSWLPHSLDEALRRWRALSHPPSAVFCANDDLALGVIKAAQALAIRVPEDLSVVGVDNFIASRDSAPPLTTVEVPVEEIGHEAVRALLRLMDGEPAETCRVPVPVKTLIVRRSTAPVSLA